MCLCVRGSKRERERKPQFTEMLFFFSSTYPVKVYRLVWVMLACRSDFTISDDTPVVETCNYKNQVSKETPTCLCLL
jgi:hypothetical protein